jgi:hypothetical protein
LGVNRTYEPTALRAHRIAPATLDAARAYRHGGARMVALPAAAFTASVLFDVLSLVADGPEQSHGYQRRAADLLRFGISSSLASLGLEVTEYLRAPRRSTGFDP